MGTYDTQIATADRLIRSKGRAAVLRKVVEDVIDLATGEASPTETDTDVRVVLLPAGPAYGTVPDTLVRTYRHRVLMAAKGLDVVPLPGDTVLLDDDVWTIDTVPMALAPDGIPILFDFVVGR